jgi:hypothetical protein
MTKEEFGLAYVCRKCEHWRDGLAAYKKQLGRLQCTGGSGCGGPITGMVFQNYKGSLDSFKDLCFVCGRDAVAGIEVAKYPDKIIGVCKEHIDFVNKSMTECGQDNKIEFYGGQSDAKEKE